MLNIMMLCICTSIASQTHNHTVVPTHFVVLRLDDDNGLLLAYMDLKSPLMTITPPKMFPRVTGTKLFITKSNHEIFAPLKIPNGTNAMFATDMKKKSMMRRFSK
eukprot:363340_1